jgi:hypothetical protein
METMIPGVLFLATAPIVLMPACIALFTRRRNASVILVFNMVVWAAVYPVMTQGAGIAGLIAILIAWLVLLRIAISEAKSQ